MSLATATLTATFHDPTGGIATGWVELTLDGPFSDPAGTHRTIEPIIKQYPLIAGALPGGVVLYCSDNAGQQPAMQSYKMTKRFNGFAKAEEVHFVMPSASSGGSVDLSTLVLYPVPIVNTPMWFTGAGSPAGVIAAPVGSLYVNINGGTPTLYVKSVGGLSTSGWQGVLAL